MGVTSQFQCPFFWGTNSWDPQQVSVVAVGGALTAPSLLLTQREVINGPIRAQPGPELPWLEKSQSNRVGQNHLYIFYLGVSIVMGLPQKIWMVFVMEKPSFEMEDDWGNPYDFLATPICKLRNIEIATSWRMSR